MKCRRYVHVRWLGAFRSLRTGRGKLNDIIDAARWELAATAYGFERAWALTPDRAFKPVGGARIGMLVSPSSSVIKKVTEGDGYSERSDGRVRADKSFYYKEVRTRPPSAKSAKGGERIGRPWQKYDEVTGVPHLVGIVVHPGATKRVRAMARQVANAVGLPYLGDTKAAAKWLDRRWKMV